MQNLDFVYFSLGCLSFYLTIHLAEAKGRGGFAGYGSSRGYGYESIVEVMDMGRAQTPMTTHPQHSIGY